MRKEKKKIETSIKNDLVYACTKTTSTIQKK